MCSKHTSKKLQLSFIAGFPALSSGNTSKPSIVQIVCKLPDGVTPSAKHLTAMLGM